MDRFEQTGQYLRKDGLAKERGMKNKCKRKVCFISSDKKYLLDLLHTISESNDCFEVKYLSAERKGTHIGMCLFTNDASVGDIWARHEENPQVWAFIPDDDFCAEYRGYIRNY